MNVQLRDHGAKTEQQLSEEQCTRLAKLKTSIADQLVELIMIMPRAVGLPKGVKPDGTVSIHISLGKQGGVGEEKATTARGCLDKGGSVVCHNGHCGCYDSEMGMCYGVIDDISP